MKITRRQLKQIIKEEIQKLDEIPTHIKMAAASRGIPHMGSAPGPRRSADTNDDPLTLGAKELRDIADDLEGATDAVSAPRDIVDGDTGEIYAQWDDPDNWNDEPFSGMEADFEIWLGKNAEYARHPDAEKLSQEHGNDAWYVRDPRNSDLPLASQPPGDLVGKYNLPSSGWGIPEPGRGTTSEGTPTDKMPASWQQILKNVL